MLEEIAEERLQGMGTWTVEKFRLLAELHHLKLGEAVSNATPVYPHYRDLSWAKVRRLAGPADGQEVLTFLSDDDGTRDPYSNVHTQYWLARCYQKAARILAELGMHCSGDLPHADRDMFERWVGVKESSVLVDRHDPNQASFVPIPVGATDRILTLLYPEYTLEELRDSAHRHSGVADLLDIREQREVRAMSEGLRAQFGRYGNAQERTRAHLKAALTAGLGGDPDKPSGGHSDRRLLAVSKEVLDPTEHDELMAEIEGEFPGWCRECGRYLTPGAAMRASPLAWPLVRTFRSSRTCPPSDRRDGTSGFIGAALSGAEPGRFLCASEPHHRYARRVLLAGMGPSRNLSADRSLTAQS
jgi:hypothetical protein